MSFRCSGVLLGRLRRGFYYLFYRAYLCSQYYFQYPTWISAFLWRVVLGLWISSFLFAAMSGMLAAYLAGRRMVLHGAVAGLVFATAQLIKGGLKSFPVLVTAFGRAYTLIILWFCLLFLISLAGGAAGGGLAHRFSRAKEKGV